MTDELRAAYEKRVLAQLDSPVECAPDGQVCFRHYGTHNPHPGCTFVTARRWAVDDDDEGDA
jgi:hypothetical protein